MTEAYLKYLFKQAFFGMLAHAAQYMGVDVNSEKGPFVIWYGNMMDENNKVSKMSRARGGGVISKLFS